MFYDIVYITDDDAAREFLQRNELLRTLEQGCMFTHGVTACCKLDHVTLWILALRHDGHDNPANAGARRKKMREHKGEFKTP